MVEVLATIIVILVVGPWLVLGSVYGLTILSEKLETKPEAKVEVIKPDNTNKNILLIVLGVLILIKYLMGV